jgi:superfamily I DNA/RNA helicase
MSIAVACNLNEEQLKAITHSGSPLVIIAGQVAVKLV